MDIPILDRVFGMEGGYVLDFSNRTFEAFFLEELGVDIYDDRWAAPGNSKANRLRCYLRQSDGYTALQTLKTLWDTSVVSLKYEHYNMGLPATGDPPCHADANFPLWSSPTSSANN